jgi:hypothetical protein
MPIVKESALAVEVVFLSEIEAILMALVSLLGMRGYLH